MRAIMKALNVMCLQPCMVQNDCSSMRTLGPGVGVVGKGVGQGGCFG